MKKVDYKAVLDDIFFNRTIMIRNILFIIISTSLVALFPMVTHFYIAIAFHRTTTYLFVATAIIAIIYTLKLFLDIHIQKFENKLYIKLAANLQGKLVLRFMKKQHPFERMYPLAVQKVQLYVLFVRKVIMENFKSLIKILAVLVVIFLFDMHLFLYTLFFIPVFVLYVFLFHRIFQRNSAHVESLLKKNVGDFTLFLHGSYTQDVWNDYKKFESLFVEKEIRNRNSLVTLNQTLHASITFFRVLYLAYFGYFAITQHLHIQGLIVGLLFITILIKAFSSILESLLFYYITRSSVMQVQKLQAANL